MEFRPPPKQYYQEFRGGISSRTIDWLSPTAHRDAVTMPYLSQILKSTERTLDIAPYELSDKQIELCKSAGLPYTDHGTQGHSHPIHKIIENSFLKVILPNMINKLPFTCFWMKESKFRELQLNTTSESTLINPRITARDNVRYQNTPTTGEVASTVVIHDAGHFIKPSQIADLFAQFPHIEKVIMSAIIPAEPYLGGKNFSLFPELYKLEHRRGDLIYRVENSETYYTQPLFGENWLITSAIRTPQVHLSVDLVASYYANRIFVITREMAVTEKYRTTASPTCVLLPEIPGRFLPTVDRLVPFDSYHDTFHSIRHLKNPTEADAKAKIRVEHAKKK